MILAFMTNAKTVRHPFGATSLVNAFPPIRVCRVKWVFAFHDRQLTMLPFADASNADALLFVFLTQTTTTTAGWSVKSIFKKIAISSVGLNGDRFYWGKGGGLRLHGSYVL